MTTELTNEQLQALLQSPDLAEKLAELGGDAIQALTKAATDAAEVRKEREVAERKQKLEDFIDEIEIRLEDEVIDRDEFRVAVAQRFDLSLKSIRTVSSGDKRKNVKARPKYRIEVDGEYKIWTGKGRTPEMFKAAKEAGELENYRMTEEEIQAHMIANKKEYGLK